MSQREKPPGSKLISFFQSWGFSRFERRALWFLVGIIVVASSVRYYNHFQLENQAAIWVEKADSVKTIDDTQHFSKPSPDNPLDINRASAVQLEILPGIGPKKAATIIDFRNANGPFNTIDDLIKVKGIGPKTLAKLHPLVTIGDSIKKVH